MFHATSARVHVYIFMNALLTVLYVSVSVLLTVKIFGTISGANCNSTTNNVPHLRQMNV